MAHTLAAIDVLIAAEVLAATTESVTCLRMLCERELKRQVVHVDVPPAPGSTSEGTRRARVIPDGWFELAVTGGRTEAISLELDRATEGQKSWRRKVAALVPWANGSYMEAFASDNLTIAVVAPSETRRDELRAWTTRELARRNQLDYADLFVFTSADPVATPPASFFFDPLWYVAQKPAPVSILRYPRQDRRQERFDFL